ncbi:MAG: protein kinase [Planctomycetes bacterium]|nr:protein kinase [Planctomycetota bacterium]
MTARDDERFERLLGEYIDRLNAGESPDHNAILTEHPDMGADLLREIETFEEFKLPKGALVGAAAQSLGTLGDYRLRRQIGRGGMGVVYEAWQNSMDRRVALKVMPKAVAMDTKTVARFIREAQIAGKLNHPNIVHVHGMGVEEQVPYYAMEFVDGKTLAQVLLKLKDVQSEVETVFGRKDCASYFENLAKAFADIAEALQHAHSHKVIHRDIKPSNLILDREGRLRILDFGLARLEGQENLTQSGDFLGTPLYMSPEQARRKKIPIDHRTDIYSLGATLYEMLTLRPPFQGKDHQDTLSQIIERDPVELRKVNARIPKDLETIVLKCLRKEAADRYGTAEAMGQDLMRFVHGEVIEARAQARWERMLRQVARRRRAWITALLIAGLVLATAATAWLAAERATERRELQYRAAVVSAVEELPLDHFLNLPGTAVLASELREEQVLLETFHILDRSQLMSSGKRIRARLEEAASLFPDRLEVRRHLARANALLGGDQTDLAITDENFTSILGEHADAWREGHSALVKGEWQAADLAFTRMLRGMSAVPETFIGATLEINVLRGVARFEVANLEGAERDFLAASLIWPRVALPAILLGRVYLREGNSSAATTWLEERFHQLGDPSIRDAFAFQSFRLLAQAGTRGELMTWVERMEPGPNRDVARMQAILWREELGELRSAGEVIAIGQRLIQSGQEDALVHSLMAIAAGELVGGTTQRHEHLTRARELARGDPHVLMLVASLLPSKEAIALCQEVLASQPSFAPAQLRLSAALVFDDPDAAIAVLENLRSRGHDLAHVFLYLGLASFNKNLFDVAQAYYEKAIALAPGWGSAHIRKAQVHWARWELDLAEREYLAAIEAPGSEPDRWTLWVLASLYYQMRRPDEALARYCQAFQRSPGPAWLPMSIFQKLFVETPRVQNFVPLDTFIPRFEAQVGSYPDDPQIQQTMALTLAHAPVRQDLVRAVRLAERAVELTGSKDARFLSSLAAVRLRAGDAPGAVEALERAAHQKLFDRSHLELLGEVRESLLPQVVSIASAEAALAKRRPEDLIATSAVDNAEAKQPIERYLQACALERAGRPEEPAAMYGTLLGSAGGGPFALRRHVACLREARRFAEARQALVAALESPGGADREAWELWWQVGHADFGLDLETLLRELPREATESAEQSGHQRDMSWLLETLLRGEPLRIDSGAEEDHTDPTGAPWSRDRFFIGGWRQTGAHGDKEVGVFFRETPESGLFPGAILGASYDRPYRDARQYPRRLPDDGYRIPLPAGRYSVTLHFAKIRGSFPNRRFTVVINGNRVLSAENPLQGGLGVVELREHQVNIDNYLLDLRIDPEESLGMISAIEVERTD